MSTTENDSGLGLAERVAARASTLSKTERRIADYLADHPEEAAFGSAEQLARAVGTSDASVVRTVKKLGYSGLPGLRSSLRAKVEAMLTPAGRLRNSLAALGGEPEGGILRSVFTDQIALLEQAKHSVDADEFDRAVALIAAGQSTVVCGIGTLGDFAEYLKLKLLRLGRRARTFRASGFLLADDLIGLTGSDVVLLLVHSSASTEFVALLERAKEVGAPVILVTNAMDEILADLVDLVITTPMGRPGMFSTHTSTLVVLEAFAFAVANVDAQYSLQAMATMNTLRERLAGGKIGGMGVLRSAVGQPRPDADGNGTPAPGLDTGAKRSRRRTTKK